MIYAYSDASNTTFSFSNNGGINNPSHLCYSISIFQFLSHQKNIISFFHSNSNDNQISKDIYEFLIKY